MQQEMLARKPILFFLLLIVFSNCQLYAQYVRFVSDLSSPFFGSLIISDLNKNELNKIVELELIKVYPAELFKDKKDNLPPMIGKLILEDSAIYFIPRFPFRPNKEYVIEIDLKEEIQSTIFIPETQKFEVTYVETVFPTADIWPANQLKIYIQFSAPMGLGNIYEQIKLSDENGHELEKPFLEIEPPLWDKHQQRLTLWFDPGRIKKHLSPNENMGPPLEENKKYKLVISENAKDANGNNLSSDFEKPFFTGLNDREKPDMSSWEIIFPESKNIKPLIIRFSEPMDRGTLESAIGIIDEKGQTVEGFTEVNDFEKTWLFYPKNNWSIGNYKLMVSEKIEDLAGNNLKRLFDQDYSEFENTKYTSAILEFSFSIN